MSLTPLRLAAFVIAIAAVIDPAITSSRSARPLVAVVSGDEDRNTNLIERVERELAKDFTVVRGSLGASAATVLVGAELPDEPALLARLAAGVLPDDPGPGVRVIGIDAPERAPVDARVLVEVDLQANGVRGRRLEAALRLGDLTLARTGLPVEGDTARLRLALPYVPSGPGPQMLTVVTGVGGVASDSASTVIHITDRRLNVLVFDPRASWISTFVRRALEEDPRFAVTHRVVTSRGVASTSGTPPASLAGAGALEEFETIVVGSPELLTAADVAGLEAFLRRRGGRVVLLMDRWTAAPVDRLTGVASWRLTSVNEPAVVLAGPDTLRARELAWPATMPTGGRVVATGTSQGESRAVLWSLPSGAGQLVVSGALDAWHHRDPVASHFNRFWTGTIAQLSADALPPVSVSISEGTLAPGQSTQVQVSVRDVLLSGSGIAAIAALFVNEQDSVPVRLSPGVVPGSFAGTITAPRRPGIYQVNVTAGAHRASAVVMVDPAARPISRAHRDLTAAFVSSRGGEVIRETELEELGGRLAAALRPVLRVETWYPMRSGWWILPFVLLLGAEWWWRRRRGLA